MYWVPGNDRRKRGIQKKPCLSTFKEGLGEMGVSWHGAHMIAYHCERRRLLVARCSERNLLYFTLLYFTLLYFSRTLLPSASSGHTTGRLSLTQLFTPVIGLPISLYHLPAMSWSYTPSSSYWLEHVCFVMGSRWCHLFDV